MSRSLVSRCATQSFIVPRTSRSSLTTIRAFSQTTSRCDDTKPPTTAAPAPEKTKSESLLDAIYGKGHTAAGKRSPASTNPISKNPLFQSFDSPSRIDTSSLSGETQPRERERAEDELEPFHFHVFAHKHNTHVTCTKPNREPIISISCGNLGYRKSRRGLYDSAYSLTKYAIDRLVHNGWPAKMRKLELSLRGFGQGREAAIKVLMSPEGKLLRDKIVRVSDATRIKFGGTRSKRPRRL